MASALISVACGATTAPLNPVYREEDFEFYLANLQPKLLLVGAGSDSPARRAATKLGVAVAELVENPEQPAGRFEIQGIPPGTYQVGMFHEVFRVETRDSESVSITIQAGETATAQLQLPG